MHHPWNSVISSTVLCQESTIHNLSLLGNILYTVYILYILYTWGMLGVLYNGSNTMHPTLWYCPFIFSVIYQLTTLYNRSRPITSDINFKVHDDERLHHHYIDFCPAWERSGTPSWTRRKKKKWGKDRCWDRIKLRPQGGGGGLNDDDGHPARRERDVWPMCTFLNFLPHNNLETPPPWWPLQ